MNLDKNLDKEIAGTVQKYWGIHKVPHDERTKEFLSQCQSDSVHFNDKDYKYYQQGSGPTVMLIHGLHSNLGSMVGIAKDLIRQGFKIVLFDAPAHGEATGSKTDFLEVRDVIRRIGDKIGEIHAIVCHSLGGVWALAAWNDEFRAKTLISIASPSTHRFLFEKFVGLHQIKDEIADGLANELEGRFGKTMWVEFSPSEIAKTIGIPGLIIHGNNDEFVPPAHAEQLHSNWDSAKVEMIEGAGHFDIVGSPKVRKLITTYLGEFQ